MNNIRRPCQYLQFGPYLRIEFRNRLKGVIRGKACISLPKKHCKDCRTECSLFDDPDKGSFNFIEPFLEEEGVEIEYPHLIIFCDGQGSSPEIRYTRNRRI